MAVIKVMQASDIHQKGDGLQRYEALKKLSDDVDLTVLLGDYFHADCYADLAKLRDEYAHKVKPEDEKAYQVFAEVHRLGGIDQVKDAVQRGAGKLEGLVKMYEQVPDIETAVVKVDKARKDWEESKEKLAPEVRKLASAQYKGLDNILKDFGSKVIGVRGNWELDNVYENMKNVTFLEKSGTFEYKGLTFAGAPNWYEVPTIMPQSCYKGAEHDPFSPDQIGALIDRYGSRDELEAFISSMQEGKQPVIPEKIKNNLEVYKRLKGVKADVLLTHKGPHRLSYQGENQLGSGIGLDLALQEMDPSIIMGGHVHDPMGYETDSYQGVRTGDKLVYVNHIDTDTKRIVGMDVYQWEGDGLKHLGYQPWKTEKKQAA